MQKNKPVGTHTVSLLLSCSHIIEEELEAVIYIPRTGDMRWCAKHKNNFEVVKVGSPTWNDVIEE